MSERDSSVLPPGWAWTTVAEIGEVKLGRQRSPKDHDGPHMRPYLRVANVYEARIDLSDVLSMNFSPAEYESFHLRSGDVLLNEGQSLHMVGRAAMYRGELPGACFQNTLVRFRPCFALTSEFALVVFRAYLHMQRFMRIARWTTNIAHLGAERFAGLEFPLAPLAEQKRITEQVDSYLPRVNDAAATLERVQRNLKRYRASVLKAAVEGRLVPTEAELARAEKRDYEPAERLLERILAERRRRWEEAELAKLKAAGKTPQDDKWRGKYQQPANPDTNRLPELPEGWCWSTIGQVAPLQAGYAFKSDGFANVGIRLLKGNNVRDGWLATDDIDYWPADDAPAFAQYKLSSGDVVLAMDRPVYSSGSRATKVAILTSEWDNALLLQRVGCFRRSPSLDAEYLYLFASGPEFRAHIVTSQNGSQDGKDLPHVSAGTVDSSPFPLPPQAEQARIVEAVARLLSVQSITERSAAESRLRCTRLRQSILKWGFEGKLADQDPTDEPASVLLERIRSERAAASTDKSKKSPARKSGRPAKKS